MGDLAALAVAVPLVVAAALLAVATVVPRRVVDVGAVLAALASAVLCALVLSDTGDGIVVYWFGGWTPRDGIALGISFTIDAIGAGLALFASVLVAAAFVFSWRQYASRYGLMTLRPAAPRPVMPASVNLPRKRTGPAVQPGKRLT